MSVKIEIYNTIKTSIETNVSDVETIRLWNSQIIENEDVEKPIVYPAVFIEFREMPWDINSIKPSHFSSAASYSKVNEQSGEWTIALHCVFEDLENESDSFVTIDPIIENIFKYTSGLEKANYFNPLKRSNEIQPIDHDRVQDWQIEYTCGVFQCGLADDDKTKIAGNTITPDIQGELDIDNVIIRTGDGEE